MRQHAAAHRAAADPLRADDAMVTAVAIYIQDDAAGWRHLTVGPSVARLAHTHIVPAGALHTSHNSSDRFQVQHMSSQPQDGML